MTHHGSTAIRHTDTQIISFATCSCGWKSEEEVYEINEQGYELRDVTKLLGALTGISLDKHLDEAKYDSLDD